MAFSGSFRPVIGVYTGEAVNALTQVANATAGNGVTTTSLNFIPDAGTSYKIVVSSRQNQNGTFSLTVTQAASVTITAPANNTSVVTGSSVVINAIASVPGGSVTRVDFYRNGGLIGSDDSAPYSVSDSPLLGTNIYTVIGVSDGGNYPSAPVNVFVLNPGVYITSPADGTMFLDTAPINVTAVALLSSGSMTNVSFLADGVPFAQDGSAPFGASWNGVTPGGHLITAIGLDDAGNSYTSAPIGIGVARTLVPLGSVWKYLDTGVDLGVEWREPDFDDSAWPSGPAELGYGDGDEATAVGFGPDPNNRFITTYFRHTFNLTGAAGYTNLVLRVKRDDGAVVYFNGNEGARFNMPAGPIAFSTTANLADDDGSNFYPTNVAALLVGNGDNVLAVEIHQNGGTSSDISFDLELLGIPVIPRNLPPEVTLTSPTNNSSFLSPASIAVTATAADLDGTIANVSFRLVNIDNSETTLGDDASAPFEVQWVAPTEGWYQVYAIATDSEGAATRSTPSFVSIYDALGTPRTQIFTPTNTASFDGPTNLSILAGATSPVGITNVEYRVNGALLAQVPQSPPLSPLTSVFTWNNATFGTSVLTTVCVDASGRRGTSAPVSIVVIAPPPNLESPTISTVVPTQGGTVASLTSIQVTFSERVTGIRAQDLLVNGLPATSVTGTTSNYTFTFPQPAIGSVSITWANDAAIFDVGYPPREFDGSDIPARWNYTLIDAVPPTIVDRVPAAGAVITNLSQVTVTFSEAVQGVDAADFLVNGSPRSG